MGDFPNKATQFKPGQPGGPGRPRTRPIADELKRLADEQLTVQAGKEKLTGTRLELLGRVAWRKAISGDFRWGKELLERIDGKVLSEFDFTSGGETLGFGDAKMQARAQAAIEGMRDDEEDE